MDKEDLRAIEAGKLIDNDKNESLTEEARMKYLKPEEAAKHVFETDGNKITILGNNKYLGCDFINNSGSIIAYNAEIGEANKGEDFKQIDLVHHLEKLEKEGFKFVASENIKDTGILHELDGYDFDESLNESLSEDIRDNIDLFDDWHDLDGPFCEILAKIPFEAAERIHDMKIDTRSRGSYDFSAFDRMEEESDKNEDYIRRLFERYNLPMKWFNDFCWVCAFNGALYDEEKYLDNDYDESINKTVEVKEDKIDEMLINDLNELYDITNSKECL